MGKILSIDNIPIYEVAPDGKCKGGLIIIHEVWGLVDHIKDVADRFAKQGYYVLAPNLLSDTDIEKHMTPSFQKDIFDPEKRNTMQPKLRSLMAPLQSPEFAQLTNDKLQECFEYLFKIPTVKERVAVLGFCFGGSYSFNLAVNEPRLLAAIPFYGHADQSSEELSFITCPVMAFYGEQDQRLIESLPDLEERMHDARVNFTSQTYVDTGHAFFNDTNPFSYNVAAAEDAWDRTLKFLETAFHDK